MSNAVKSRPVRERKRVLTSLGEDSGEPYEGEGTRKSRKVMQRTPSSLREAYHLSVPLKRGPKGGSTVLPSAHEKAWSDLRGVRVEGTGVGVGVGGVAVDLDAGMEAVFPFSFAGVALVLPALGETPGFADTRFVPLSAAGAAHCTVDSVRAPNPATRFRSSRRINTSSKGLLSTSGLPVIILCSRRKAPTRDLAALPVTVRDERMSNKRLMSGGRVFLSTLIGR